ncbi:MAG: hypothetical protein WA789_20190, partial [Candidatus Acidiferrum sp.]
RCAEIRVSQDDRFSVSEEKRRRRDFAPVAKSMDNGLVGRWAVEKDRKRVLQGFVVWTAERFSPRGAGG